MHLQYFTHQTRVGRRIYFSLIWRGLTTEDLARLTNIPLNKIIEYETQDIPIPLEDIEKISAALNMRNYIYDVYNGEIQ